MGQKDELEYWLRQSMVSFTNDFEARVQTKRAPGSARAMFVDREAFRTRRIDRLRDFSTCQRLGTQQTWLSVSSRTRATNFDGARIQNESAPAEQPRRGYWPETQHVDIDHCSTRHHIV